MRMPPKVSILEGLILRGGVVWKGLGGVAVGVGVSLPVAFEISKTEPTPG